MQHRYHIACVTYQQPLAYQKVKIYSATLVETTTVPIKKNPAPINCNVLTTASLFYCYKTFVI